jgi:hypothetical protein
MNILYISQYFFFFFWGGKIAKFQKNWEKISLHFGLWILTLVWLHFFFFFFKTFFLKAI